MNRAIGRVYAVLAGGLVLLLGFTAYWQLWAESSLSARRDNAHQVIHQLSIKRGLILAADGTKLAVNRAGKTADGRRVYTRRYPTRRMFAHIVGYSSATDGRAGIERSANDYLVGAHTDLGGALENELHSLAGGAVVGDDVQLSLIPAAQRAAMSALAATGKPGAVCALEPRTGRVLVSASWPSFDPNKAVQGTLPVRPGSALVNRATQGLYPPGSSIKPLIAALALESGRYTTESDFTDPGFFVEYGRKITNDSVERFSGTFDLAFALTHSINTVFAKLGWELLPRPIALPGPDEGLRALRVLRDPPARLPDRPARGLRHRSLAAPTSSAPRTRRSILRDGDRPGQPRGDADADGDGRRVVRERRRRDEAHAGRSRALARRLAALRTPLGAAQPCVQRADGDERDGDDEARRRRGNGHRCADPGHPDRRQDRYGPDGPARGAGRVVHRVAPADNPQVAVAVVVERTAEYGGRAAARPPAT